MVPVDYVASLVVAASSISQMKGNGVSVMQVTPQPRSMSWADFLSAPSQYGYEVRKAESYESWRDAVVAYVEQHSDWAAMPLLDLVTSDFPTSTTPRYLDDRNARAALKSDSPATCNSWIDRNLVGLYLSYLIKVGFVAAPPGSGAKDVLPTAKISETQMAALGRLKGRGKIGKGMQANGVVG